MAKVIYCSKVNPAAGCDHVVRGETMDELMKNVQAHAGGNNDRTVQCNGSSEKNFVLARGTKRGIPREERGAIQRGIGQAFEGAIVYEDIAYPLRLLPRHGIREFHIERKIFVGKLCAA